MPFKLSIGTAAIVEEPMYTNEAIATFAEADNPSFDMRYLYYILPIYVPQNAGVNIYDAPLLNAERIKNARIPMPPLAQQQKVADYLDCETAEIDAMSDDLDKMEALLRERRKKMIADRFGSDVPTAPLWKFVTVSPSTPEIYELKDDEDITFIPLEDVWTNRSPEDFEVVPWSSSLSSYTHFRNGDILLPKVTPTVTHGRAMVAEIATEAGVATSEVYTLRPREITNPRWLTYFLTSPLFLDLAGVSVFGTGGLKRISTQFVQSFQVPDMSRKEQDHLVTVLDSDTAEVDSMLTDIQELRALLAERRSALITAVVTGQLDIPKLTEAHDGEDH